MNKPRNFVTLALIKRSSGCGAHIKSNKAKRKQSKQKLQREIQQAKSENF